MPATARMRPLLMGATLLAWPLHTSAQSAPHAAVPHRQPHFTPASTLPDSAPMPGAAAALAKPYGGTPVDVLTYHYNNARTGWNQNETDLTPASVGSSGFGLLATLQVDGNVFAQPLLATAITLADGSTHDVLIVATGHNSVYAYDARSYALLWQVNLGPAQSSTDVGCGDVKPEYGISGTPVIVRGTTGVATLYVVAATEPTAASFATQLHALNVATGADTIAPVVIAPSATLADGSTLRFDPQNQWSRASLALQSGRLYVSIGSHCDNNANNISGWLLQYNQQLQQQAAFHTIETSHFGTELASIWMAGFAPAIDAKGNVFVVTGNGDTSARSKDWGESVLRLPASLASVGSRFTPAGFAALNDGDVDFGSGGVMLLPSVPGQTVPPLAVAIGKSAVLYLLDQGKLGGLKPDDSGALQASDLSTTGQRGVWGGPAFYDGANGPVVFAQIEHAPLVGYAVTTVGTAALTATTKGSTSSGYGGSLPIVSSNGATGGSGIVWVIRRSAPIELEAYNADTLGTPLFSANVGNWSNSNQNSFLTAMEANGRVYAPGYKVVKVFGLQ